MKIKIEIEAEDKQDVMSHLSIIRTQITAVLSGKADNGEDSLSHAGMRSNHTVTIEE